MSSFTLNDLFVEIQLPFIVNWINILCVALETQTLGDLRDYTISAVFKTRLYESALTIAQNVEKK